MKPQQYSTVDLHPAQGELKQQFWSEGLEQGVHSITQLHLDSMRGQT